jgi:hypothetical protein
MGRLRFPSVGRHPFLPFLLPVMVRTEGGEVKKKEKASEQERVEKAAGASRLFKEAGRRPSTSYPLTEQSQEFNKQFKPPGNESGV